jgi:hypothetical protein
VKSDAALTFLSLALRECCVRRLSFGLTVLAMAAGAGVVTGALAALGAHDRETDATLRQQLEAMQAGLRRYDESLQQAMRHLGFNLVLLAADQPLADFHSEGYASTTMPEDHLRRLVEAGLLTAEQLVPVLRRRVRWEERGWTVLVQAWGTPSGQTADSTPPPAVSTVPPGMVDLGYELHRGLKLQPGDRVHFVGADFTVRDCRPETGTRDDITVWMDLRQAQECLGLPGRISEVRALECRTAWNRVSQVRAEIAQVLPGVAVLEEAGETLALAAAREAFENGQREVIARLQSDRAAQRLTRAGLVEGVCAVALALAGVASGLLAWLNARQRRTEVALWAALGASAGQVHGLLLWRTALATLAGVPLGLAVACPWWGWPGAMRLAAWALVGFGITLVVAVPSAIAATAVALRQEPAEVLKSDP